MKRILIITALAAATALPATSSADSAGDATTARGGQDLEIPFVVRYIGNKPVEIRRFKFRKFTVTCAVGGPVDLRGRIGAMKVNDAGKFQGNVRKGSGKVHAEGKVKNSGRVEGFLKATGKFGTAERCGTKVNWVAPPN